MKLSKTEMKLIEQSKRNNHGIFGLIFGHKGRRSYGRRDLEAAQKLIEKGLAKKISSQRGYLANDAWVEQVYKIVKH